MIKQLTVSGIHTDLNKDVTKYAQKKVAKLDAYMPRHARKTASAEVKLKEEIVKTKKQCTAEVVISVPGEVITATETTVNMYAAIDIVEEKLKSQLRKYKELTTDHKSALGKSRVRATLAKLSRKSHESAI